MNTYVLEDKTYDVSKLSSEGQACFQLLATVQERIDTYQADLTIAQAAGVALHQKMQEFLDDTSVIEADELEG